MAIPPHRHRVRFRGQIAGVGTTSGTRVVVGRWDHGPLGSFADAMVERPDGHRLLLAPSPDVSRFVAATYEFDEIRVERFEVLVGPHEWRVRGDSLDLDLRIGGPTALGRLLGHARDVMGRALEAGGTSFDTLYVNVNGASGYFERSLNAYGRQGLPCRRCGTLMRREAFMNRSSFSCPRCQVRPRHPAP